MWRVFTELGAEGGGHIEMHEAEEIRKYKLQNSSHNETNTKQWEKF